MNPLTAIGKSVPSLPTSPEAADADLQRRFELAIATHTNNTRQSTTRRVDQLLTDSATNSTTADLHATHDENEELPPFASTHQATDDPHKHTLPLPCHSSSSFSHKREENQANLEQKKESQEHDTRANSLATPDLPVHTPNLEPANMTPAVVPHPLPGQYVPAQPQNQKKSLLASVDRLNEIAIEIKESLSAPAILARQPDLALPATNLKPVDIMSSVVVYPDTATIPAQKDANDEPIYYAVAQTTPDISRSQQDTQEQDILPRQQAGLAFPIPHANEISITEKKVLTEIETYHLLASKPKESDLQPSYPDESNGKMPFFPQTQLLPGERILATMQATSTISPLLEMLIDKLSVEISIELTRQQRPPTLHLTLPNLGAIEIQLTNENGKLQIEILANPAAQQQLKQARFELLERLQLLYPTQTVELSLPSQTDSEHGSRQSRSVYEEWKNDV
ncbi:type III secretion system needle length determinant [Photorhabdus temperata]|uniref:Type III secretion system needle length determinant n=1 Tax=Photorhabdus temperata subsp. temperata Meg1 TaxID=1393735 RepID=A0A081S1T4_PHOTE|nr:type III secretion system needle length determinant [Photorhabdus temperata]KER04887.1 type III secretion system needle length determinant [Photorhabdus temperata subsp. temperata Meg1]MCT8345961.1 type III secretion system needle length determinant [Photorhabdus temperata]